MSKNQRAFFFLSIVLRSSFLRVASLLCALPLAKERKALFSLSLSPLLMSATERERERMRMRSHSRGDFRHPNFQNVFSEKMMMMMDTHFSQKEETRKIKTGTERERNARAT